MNPPVNGRPNALDRLLQDELNRLVDRVAAVARVGTVAESQGRHPELRTRIEQSEARLAGLRLELLDRYAEWQRALDECEDLWALAELESEPPALPAGLRAA